ncbi:MAG: ATP-binding protein, partial [Chloroflexi bacterium]
RKIWGSDWVTRLIHASQEDIEFVLEKTNIASGTLTALQRRLERFQRWDFLVKETPDDSVQKIIDLLVEQQKSVVLEFGRYGNSLDAYMLVANYLTRRIHAAYVEKMERSLGDKAMQPPQLLITIEEAHKFLDPQVARQTTFGVIAREMRKYNVTLLVVDQRPSAIDEEVMSQIGTRVTALLDNERDIHAVLNGISGASGLREVLARMETKQQAIIMGHAVPMPVVIKPRTYDEDFYKAVTVQPVNTAQAKKSLGNSGRRRV